MNSTLPSTPGRRNPGPAWRKAMAHGMDMSLLEEALRLTPQQRLEAHSRALAAAEALRRAMEQHRAKA